VTTPRRDERLARGPPGAARTWNRLTFMTGRCQPGSTHLIVHNFYYTACMNDAANYAISVEVAHRFLDDQSTPEDGRYAFAYTIRILNQGRVAARLVARHWRITDANGRTERVDGDGVIGEQPRLRPGEDFRYTSGVMLETEHGTMQGHYDMVADDGTEFAAPIAPFVLTVPRTLH